MVSEAICKLKLALLAEKYAICRLESGVSIPVWATSADFSSVTRTPDELSIVCPQENVPDGIECEKDWRCLKVEGKLDFSQTGILASLTVPLANAGISIFAISTFDTDCLLVKQKSLDRAIQVLSQAGTEVRE